MIYDLNILILSCILFMTYEHVLNFLNMYFYTRLPTSLSFCSYRVKKGPMNFSEVEYMLAGSQNECTVHMLIASGNNRPVTEVTYNAHYDKNYCECTVRSYSTCWK